jgi:hypothetical protein
MLCFKVLVIVNAPSNVVGNITKIKYFSIAFSIIVKSYRPINKHVHKAHLAAVAATTTTTSHCSYIYLFMHINVARRYICQRYFVLAFYRFDLDH